jgi:hypothetical protein
MPQTATSTEFREVSPSEVRDEDEAFGGRLARADAIVAVANRSAAATFGAKTIEDQLELLSYMRRGGTDRIELVRRREDLRIVWRLMAATGLGVAVLTVGVVLTVIALAGGALAPNPLIALSVLFTGLVLVTTLVVALRNG